MYLFVLSLASEFAMRQDPIGGSHENRGQQWAELRFSQ